MDNCILRIYRREKNNPRILVGVVEGVGVEGNKAFSNLDELWTILNLTKNSRRARKEERHLNNDEDIHSNK